MDKTGITGKSCFLHAYGPKLHSYGPNRRSYPGMKMLLKRVHNGKARKPAVLIPAFQAEGTDTGNGRGFAACVYFDREVCIVKYRGLLAQRQ
ncbi:hypothetical protein A4R26_16345 [Niastella populi]|uniref:Uncharacterized protein n=1 Tax=Niastella populi TaxID=550983 RepID=A0A1V9G1U4_9BACT|nr:hypothetical protein A4R26_16345 [Niastella populi]